jgi:hypothetical protein
VPSALGRLGAAGQGPPILPMKLQPQREDAIQRAVFEHLAVRGVPRLFAFHPANGGYRLPVEAARLKELGVRPGVPDVITFHRGQLYAIELKREGGRATDAQLQAIEDIRAAGGHAQVYCGLDSALAVLEDWGSLRGYG